MIDLDVFIIGFTLYLIWKICIFWRYRNRNRRHVVKVSDIVHDLPYAMDAEGVTPEENYDSGESDEEYDMLNKSRVFTFTPSDILNQH